MPDELGTRVEGAGAPLSSLAQDGQVAVDPERYFRSGWCQHYGEFLGSLGILRA